MGVTTSVPTCDEVSEDEQQSMPGWSGKSAAAHGGMAFSSEPNGPAIKGACVSRSRCMPLIIGMESVYHFCASFQQLSFDVAGNLLSPMCSVPTKRFNVLGGLTSCDMENVEQHGPMSQSCWTHNIFSDGLIVACRKRSRPHVPIMFFLVNFER